MWLDVAFICRYGHQDVHKILGVERPLTDMERALFIRALQEHVEIEFDQKAKVGIVGPSE